MPNTSSSVPFLLSSSMSSIRSRRPSACLSSSQGSGLLQQLGSGMVRQLTLGSSYQHPANGRAFPSSNVRKCPSSVTLDRSLPAAAAAAAASDSYFVNIHVAYYTGGVPSYHRVLVLPSLIRVNALFLDHGRFTFQETILHSGSNISCGHCLPCLFATY